MNRNKNLGKILIVDDNASNLKVLYTYLKDAGYEVVVAEDGRAGIEVVENSYPELVLLDVMMPGMDGFEVCRRLKAKIETRDIPIIFLTALSEAVNKVKGFEVGGVDYITQPTENQEVIARVRTHLITNRMRQKLQRRNAELQAEIERRQQIEQELKRSRNLLQANNDNLEQTVADRTAELSNSNQDLEQFAYIASHDLRQPLRKIRMCTEYLAEDYVHCFDEQAKEYMKYITKSTDRMYLLIDDLLAYSRVGKQKKESLAVNTEDIVKDCIEDLSFTIAEKQATINYSNLPTINGNPREIAQLFQNLLANALKFTSNRPPEINITATQVGKRWQFSFADNGIGLELKYADKIFEMFQRLHQNSEYEGTGIGLAICQKVVNSHGGTIWVESELGKGSTFYFTILLDRS